MYLHVLKEHNYLVSLIKLLHTQILFTESMHMLFVLLIIS